ncbi:MAG: MATE family efflux transporter, partial [Candidatus Aenigmatarchaeota archaeon]
YWLFASPLCALTLGIEVITARRKGEGSEGECASILRSALVYGFLAGILAYCLVKLSQPIITARMGVEQTLRSYVDDYVNWRMISIPFFAISCALRDFFYGIGESHIDMKASVLMNAVNFILCLIFLSVGIINPSIGVKAVAFASSIGTIAGLLFFLYSALRSKYNKNGLTSRIGRALVDQIYNIFMLSWPVAVQSLLGMISILFFYRIISLIGVEELAVTHILSSICSFVFMPVAAIGYGVPIIAGQYLGAGRKWHAHSCGWTAIFMATVYSVFVCIVFLILPEWIMKLFTADRKVIELGAMGLRIMGIAQIFESAGYVICHLLQGVGMSFWIMAIDSLLTWLVFIPVSYFFSLRLDLGLLGAWGGWIIYILFLSLISYLIFKKRRWMEIRV